MSSTSKTTPKLKRSTWFGEPAKAGFDRGHLFADAVLYELLVRSSNPPPSSSSIQEIRKFNQDSFGAIYMKPEFNRGDMKSDEMALLAVVKKEARNEELSWDQIQLALFYACRLNLMRLEGLLDRQLWLNMVLYLYEVLKDEPKLHPLSYDDWQQLSKKGLLYRSWMNDHNSIVMDSDDDDDYSDDEFEPVPSALEWVAENPFLELILQPYSISPDDEAAAVVVSEQKKNKKEHMETRRQGKKKTTTTTTTERPDSAKKQKVRSRL
jgi:hypothetical protein